MSDRHGRLGTFAALTPIRDLDGLRAALAAWPHGERCGESPMSRVPGTHFARFVVIDRLRREDARQPPDALPCPYLLFSAFCDGDPGSWLRGLAAAIPGEAHDVWRHCAGHPGHPGRNGASFVAWLERHRVPATAIFAADSQATVAEIHEALAFRERFREWALHPEQQRLRQTAFEAFAGLEAPR